MTDQRARSQPDRTGRPVPVEQSQEPERVVLSSVPYLGSSVRLAATGGNWVRR